MTISMTWFKLQKIWPSRHAMFDIVQSVSVAFCDPVSLSALLKVDYVIYLPSGSVVSRRAFLQSAHGVV